MPDSSSALTAPAPRPSRAAAPSITTKFPPASSFPRLRRPRTKAAAWGYDGLELACWGDHFEVDKALADKNYCKGRWETLRRHYVEVPWEPRVKGAVPKELGSLFDIRV